MRWWLALASGVIALLIFLLPRYGDRQSPHERDAVKIVQSSSPSAPIVRRTPDAALIKPSPPTPQRSVAAASSKEEEAPAWLRENPALEPRALHAKLRQETRDAEWASRAEGAIKLQLAKVPYIGGVENSSIRCASTVCEINGVAPPDLANANINSAWQALQGNDLRDELRKQGLVSASSIFGSNNGKATYTLYYKRGQNER